MTIANMKQCYSVSPALAGVKIFIASLDVVHVGTEVGLSPRNVAETLLPPVAAFAEPYSPALALHALTYAAVAATGRQPIALIAKGLSGVEQLLESLKVLHIDEDIAHSALDLATLLARRRGDAQGIHAMLSSHINRCTAIPLSYLSDNASVESVQKCAELASELLKVGYRATYANVNQYKYFVFFLPTLLRNSAIIFEVNESFVLRLYLIPSRAK